MIPYANEKDGDEASIVSSFTYEKAKKIKWYHHILLNRPLKVISTVLLLSILAPILIYQYVLYANREVPPPDGHSFGSCVVPRISRIPCGPANISESECHQQCCYDRQNFFCYQRIPSRFSFIAPGGVKWTEEQIFTARFPTVPFNSQPSVAGIRLSVDEVSSTHLSLTYYDAQDELLSGSRLDEKSYSYHISTPELSVMVSVNGTAIFNTNRGPTIASDNIWEVAFKLTDHSMYGLGEIPLKPGTVKVIYNYEGGISSIPLIFARTNESYHGLLFEIATPTEVTVLENNQLVVRSLTKTGLKLHLFTGPMPQDIMKEVMEMFGAQKQLDYWMLGAHICSDVSTTDEEALSDLTSFITSAITARVPYESHCGIRPIVFEDEVENMAATPVTSGANAVRNAQKRFVPHISPYIRYEDPTPEEISTTTEAAETTTVQIPSPKTTEKDTCNIACEFQHLMLRRSDADPSPYIGTADGHTVVYPDYSGNVTEQNLLLDRLWPYDVVLDGVVLENNWPLDSSYKRHNETDLPYFSQELQWAFNHTPQWDVRTPQGSFFFHYHNRYGNRFLEAFRRKLNETPPFPTWSTTQWMMTDAVVNRQNVPTTWLGLRKELVQAALGGISGQWLWSSPICGDTESFDLESQESLCLKWYMAATYFPLIKIHSKTTPRHPLAFEGTHRTLVINALNERMSLMSYFYSVLQEGPLLKPMFYQFPFSESLIDLNTQFAIGDELLIAPNLQPMQSHVHVRMPPGTWYEFKSGLKIQSEEGEAVTMLTTESDFITLIRGGSIVPVQKVIANTAELTRRNSPFTLVIATERVNTTNPALNTVGKAEASQASGQLRMDGPMTIYFSVNDNQLVITSEGDDFDFFCGDLAISSNSIRDVDIYGLSEEFNNFDNHRNVVANIDLCNLRTEEIAFTLY